jgi:hypothetical protein
MRDPGPKTRRYRSDTTVGPCRDNQKYTPCSQDLVEVEGHKDYHYTCGYRTWWSASRKCNIDPIQSYNIVKVLNVHQLSHIHTYQRKHQRRTTRSVSVAGLEWSARITNTWEWSCIHLYAAASNIYKGVSVVFLPLVLKLYSGHRESNSVT